MKIAGIDIRVETKEDMVKDIFAKYQQAQIKESKEKKRFPLSPSGALKDDIDLYHELIAFYEGEKNAVEEMGGETYHLLNLGHHIEPLVLDLINLELNIIERNKRVKYGTLVRKNGEIVDLSGELDAIAEDKYSKEQFIVDSKTSGKFAFEKKEVKEDYIAQLNLYMHATGIKKALICYYCKDNSKMRIHEFEYNKDLVEFVLAKFQRLMDAYEAKMPPKMVSYWGGESWRPGYSKYRNILHKDFAISLLDREVVEVDSLLKEVILIKENTKKAIDFLANTYYNKLVKDKNGVQLYLSLTTKGLVIKLKDKDGMTRL